MKETSREKERERERKRELVGRELVGSMKERKRKLDISGGNGGGGGRVNPLTNDVYSERYFTLLEKRKTLPVYQQKEEFIEKIKRENVIVLVGETGSGKTTQVAQFALDAGVIGTIQYMILVPIKAYDDDDYGDDDDDRVCVRDVYISAETMICEMK